MVVVVASESQYLLSKYMFTRKFEDLTSIVTVCLLTGEKSGAVLVWEPGCEGEGKTGTYCWDGRKDSW